ncbi:Cd(II)/Pb(II)-responsive transcriptional regulator [Amphibiibacter pelophylacis]|uniref:Cd(II)/Pb(II)-responsive transcriptional regulator n=1 Tax=Amphibiibacter pelophylacis TaxID=1799477 RepID=A0ACC6P3S8_9BURK
MNIGELARRAGCTVESLRHYEREGLLPPPARRDNGYRDYRSEHLQRLVFVRRCRDLDMSLKDIARLLDLADATRAPCAEVNSLVDEQIVRVQTRLAELGQLLGQLEALRSHCSGESKTCGILEELVQGVGE